MEKLSIEEKAKAYEEVREKIAIRFGSKVADEIFSQFEISEDERIRKSIIAIINNYVDNSNTFKPKMIAWLEKQGKLIAELQKTYAEIGRLVKENYYLKEKQGEQKIADNLEPKFKVGDWVVYNRNDHSREIMQIYDIKDGRYYFTDNVHFSWSVKECDEKSHLWSIEDAKDGDVLVLKDNTFGTMIFICAGFAMNDSTQVVDYHFMYNFSTGLAHKKAGDFMGNLTLDFHPATREQRQVLFDKMRECGYEWDAEKKEVKKIEQKPAWSEEDEEKFSLIHAILIDAKSPNNCTSDSTYYREVTESIDWLKSLKYRVGCEVNCTTTWKPSDEQIDALSKILKYFRMMNAFGETIDGLKELLEQLKKLK